MIWLKGRISLQELKWVGREGLRQHIVANAAIPLLERVPNSAGFDSPTIPNGEAITKTRMTGRFARETIAVREAVLLETCGQ